MNRIEGRSNNHSRIFQLLFSYSLSTMIGSDGGCGGGDLKIVAVGIFIVVYAVADEILKWLNYHQLISNCEWRLLFHNTTTRCLQIEGAYNFYYRGDDHYSHESSFQEWISTVLDSSVTFQIGSCLQQLVHMVECTMLVLLLQPAPEVFDLFDDIILMTEGKIPYHPVNTC